MLRNLFQNVFSVAICPFIESIVLRFQFYAGVSSYIPYPEWACVFYLLSVSRPASIIARELQDLVETLTIKASFFTQLPYVLVFCCLCYKVLAV